MNLAPPAVTIVLLALVLTAFHLASEAPAAPPRARLAPTAATAGVAHVVHQLALPTPRVTPQPPTPEPTLPPPTPEPTLPPPTPEVSHSAPNRIIIGSIHLDRLLVSVGLAPNNDPVVPDHDVAWYNRSASPGDGDNIVLWAHALRFAAAPELPAPFERVRDARVGDSITVITADGAAHEYVIAEQLWATPDQVAYILPTGDERLTLVNCIGDYVVDATGAVVSMTHRLITIARPVAGT